MMKRRRLLLLFFGIVGSVLMVWFLQKSVNNTPVKEVFATESVHQTSDGFGLPFTIPGTTLQATEMSAYDGPFLEDGSGREVVNVAALHVYNNGEKEIRRACIILQTDHGRYVFYGRHLPPKATVVLLEMDCVAYQKGRINDCSGWQELSEQPPIEGIAITDRDNGTLIVTNTTDVHLQNLQLFYKAWLSPPDVYVGGITYSVTIPHLAPGQTELLFPDRYATGYSKVVSVIAEES